MKRLYSTAGTGAILIWAAIVFAQTTSTATLSLPGSQRTIATVESNGRTFFSADDVVTALGGTVTSDNHGFLATIGDQQAAFGPDTRFGVVRDDLIEMPVEPMVVDGRAYVPWQFFQGVLQKSSNQQVSWDATNRILAIRPSPKQTLNAQLSLVDLGGLSKLVIQLSGKSDYDVSRERDYYAIRFKSPIQAPPEQSFDDPLVTRMVSRNNEIDVWFASPEVTATSYSLEKPFRVVLDFRKGVPELKPGVTLQTPLAVPNAKPAGIRTIVLDPGHGGKEVGAIGPSGLMEKDATLELCRRLQNLLTSRLGVRVVLTRDDDSVVPLEQRTAVANQYKADLFLSVHMNAATVKGAKGTETYFLSLDASDEVARRAAEIENASASSAPGGKSDLKMILWDLAQQEYLNESHRLAVDVQDEMNTLAGIQGRGVKQAPFKVLVGATMPAALVEVAFITNPDEEAKLRSDRFQEQAADALEHAIAKFKSEYEARIGLGGPETSGRAAAPAAAAAPPPASPAPSKKSGSS
ncbi:MAG: N-acetylmuramoyl-L-alanine amidase [Thermoanaerobaculia bacterium]